MPSKIFLVSAYLFVFVGTLAARDEKGRIPPLRGNGMMFTENKGQIVDMKQQARPDILFKGDGAGMDVYIRRTGVSYVANNLTEIIQKADAQLEKFRENKSQGNIDEQKTKEDILSKEILRLHRIDFDFVNCNPVIETVTDQQVEGYANFYYTYCPAGITHVNSFNEVIQKNIYNNIDVKYYASTSLDVGSTKGLKYDIVIKPGGNPDNIKLKYSGTNGLYLKNGNLFIKTSFGEMEEWMPKVYQNINGKIVDVKAEYQLASTSDSNGKKGEEIVSFKLDAYNRSFPLVIDPWASYYGSGTYGSAVTTDVLGNVAFTGYASSSSGFPVSAGAMQSVGGGSLDAFVVEMDANGSRLWATYYGGSGFEMGKGIAADDAGNILIAGYTSSTNLPVAATGANVVYQNTSGTGFLLKLDKNGANLWSTYNTVTASDVTTFSNNVFLYSSGGGVSADAFVTEFAPNGAYNWGVTIGGTKAERTYGIACDLVGNIYITGITYSTDFPVPGGYQTTNAGTGDAFICKLSPTGTQLWGTYYGGAGADYGMAIVTDELNNVIISGCTSSTTSIASVGASQTVFGGGTFPNDAFVAKFSSNGAWLWGTYLGGDNDEISYGIVTDKSNNIYIVGEWEDTNSGSLPISTCAIQPVFGGAEDQFIAKYAPDGTLRCLTYRGGTTEDEMDNFWSSNPFGGSLAIYDNSLYITGETGGGYPVTAGAFQTTATSLCAFIDQLCINLCEAKTLALDYTANTNVCIGDPVTFTPTINNSCDTSGYQFRWTFVGGSPSSSSAVKPVVTYGSPGSYSAKLVLTTSCKTDSVIKTSYIIVNNCACALTASTNSTSNAKCKGGSDGTASVTIGSGSGGPYTYNWSNGSSGTTTATIIPVTGLSAGTYAVTITDGTCTSVSSVTINEPVAIEINSMISTMAACGTNTGSVSANASGGTGTLTYSWSNTAAGSNVNNLGAGTYTLTVTDANACTTTGNVSVTSNPGPTINSLIPIDVLCKGAATGSATITASGTGTLSYSWSTGATGNTFNDVIAGNYTVTVTDGNGCVNIATFTITEPPSMISVSVTASNSGCTATNGMASVVASGGSGGFTYSWSNAATSKTINNLSSGIYTVTVTDGNGCSVTKAQTVVAAPGITFGASTITAANCGLSNGSAIANASGGYGALTYNWSNSSTGATATNLASGSYTIGVTDASGCIATSTVIITSTGAQTLVSAITNVTCNGAGNGSAQINISGGTAPYTYTWTNGQNGSTVSTQIVGGNLSATNYTITVTDANNCTAIKSVTLTEPPAITFNTPNVNSASCGQSNGNATLTASGGTGTFTYSWSNSASGSTATGLAAGNYIITATDANGCTATQSVNVNNNPGPTINGFFSGNVSCNGTATGSVVVTANGGAGALTYSWSTGSTATTISNQIAGTYTVTVTDVNGCKAVSTTQITEPALITANIFSSAASCGLSNGGAAITSLTGGTGTLSYKWSTGSTNSSLSNLTAGTYSLSIKDTYGCSKTEVISISDNPGPAITSLSQSDPLCAGLGTGAANIVATGTGALIYSWSNGASGQTISSVSAGTYAVTVTDGNSCKTVSTVIITEPAPIVLGSISVTNTACNAATGTLTLNTTSGGTGAYTYSWSNGASTSINTGLTSIAYTVTVSDANGCSQTEAATVGTVGGPTVNSSVSSTIKCNGGTGTAMAIASGGIPLYTYSWSTGVSTITSLLNNSLTSLPANAYSVTITDANGCSAVSSITLTQPAILSATAMSTPASCGLANGAAAALASGGTLNYTYSWSNGATGQTINNLAEAIYTVTATDANGCNTTSTTILTSIGTGSININPATQTIVEGNSVAITVSGGTIYTWTPSGSLTCSICSNPIASPAITTTYTITSIDQNGCTVSGELLITVKPACIGDDQDVFIPNVFSPNGDGKNDVLYIGGNGLSDIYWAIYDRWGNLVFEAYDQNHGWDGAVKGNPMGTGTYVYYLKATCIKTNAEVKLKGNVSIVK